MIIKLILIVPLLTMVFYTVTGIVKRKVWIAGPPPVFHATKEKDSRALVFGVLFLLLYIFFMFYFISEMKLSFDYKDWIRVIVFSVFSTWFVIFSEKKLDNIKNPFKILIPTLFAIAIVSLLIMFYFLFQ